MYSVQFNHCIVLISHCTVLQEGKCSIYPINTREKDLQNCNLIQVIYHKFNNFSKPRLLLPRSKTVIKNSNIVKKFKYYRNYYYVMYLGCFQCVNDKIYWVLLELGGGGGEHLLHSYSD